MIAKKFIQVLVHGEEDILSLLLCLLAESDAEYCLIGGMAVNAYAEPVVSLDLDIVIAAPKVDAFCRRAESKGLKAESFAHSINLSSPKSDLRIQVQTDARYQDFLARGQEKIVLGYTLKVAHVADVLQGKAWAYLDRERRPSKRQKDLADIMRLVENYPALAEQLSPKIRKSLE